MELVDDSKVPVWFKNLPPKDQKRLRDFLNKNTEHIITYGMASSLFPDEVIAMFFRFGNMVRNAELKGEKK